MLLSFWLLVCDLHSWNLRFFLGNTTKKMAFPRLQMGLKALTFTIIILYQLFIYSQLVGKRYFSVGNKSMLTVWNKNMDWILSKSILFSNRELGSTIHGVYHHLLLLQLWGFSNKIIAPYTSFSILFPKGQHKEIRSNFHVIKTWQTFLWTWLYLNLFLKGRFCIKSMFWQDLVFVMLLSQKHL